MADSTLARPPAHDPMVRICGTETISYYREVPLSQLREAAGIDDEDAELSELVEQARQDGAFCETVERHGDVASSTWTASFADAQGEG